MLSGLELTVTIRHEGARLDRFLLDTVPTATVRAVRAALELGDVSTGGRKASKGESVHAGQEILVERIAEPPDWLPVPGDVPGAAVVYRDVDIAVILKPPGIQTEPIAPFEEGTLAGYLLRSFPALLEWISDARIPFLSRLDRDTSGVVLGALNARSFEFLLAERRAGRISKRYICVVSGRLLNPVTIDAAIESRGGKRVRVLREVVESNPGYWTRIVPLSWSGDTTVVSAGISKGKRHQIRAHLSAIGYPILGDTIYGREGGATEGRLMLHAAEVAFTHPSSGERMTVVSPMPAGFGIQRLP